MTQADLSPLTTWLTEPLSRDVERSVDRLRRSEDVQHVALMPDVHLSRDVCIGAVVATNDLVYPSAVGGDIGCGMAALAFDAEAALIDNERAAASVLKGFYEYVPANKHRQTRELPDELRKLQLSDTRLLQLADRDGRVQLGTLGRGNHFLELQSDQDGRLWVMIHSGSRAMGQAVLNRYLNSANCGRVGLKWLDVNDGQGQAYLADVHWARSYAAHNRLAMLNAVTELFQSLFSATADWDSLIHCDHNHVQREEHHGELRWIHRKGAQSATADELGVIPGSMGAVSFHTAGRGCQESLKSCSHGAGRKLSRTEARQKISGKEFSRQVHGLSFDHRRSAKLRDEAPSAYKDIRQVMKAQRALTRLVRELTPILTYKGV